MWGLFERSYNNNIKPPTLKATRYMCIVLHLDKKKSTNVLMSGTLA